MLIVVRVWLTMTIGKGMLYRHTCTVCTIHVYGYLSVEYYMYIATSMFEYITCSYNSTNVIVQLVHYMSIHAYMYTFIMYTYNSQSKNPYTCTHVIHAIPNRIPTHA